MPRAKTLLLIAMMLWLPMKGVLAIAMPTCPGESPAVQMAAGSTEHGGCHGAQRGHEGDRPALPHVSCDHCMNCYLSVAPFLTAEPIPAASPRPDVPVVAGAESFLSRTPAPLDRPPLAS